MDSVAPPQLLAAAMASAPFGSPSAATRTGQPASRRTRAAT